MEDARPWSRFTLYDGYRTSGTMIMELRKTGDSYGPCPPLRLPAHRPRGRRSSASSCSPGSPPADARPGRRPLRAVGRLLPGGARYRSRGPPRPSSRSAPSRSTAARSAASPRAPGTIPGWDIAGVVRAAAADGSGPARAHASSASSPRAPGPSSPPSDTGSPRSPATSRFEAASTLPVAGLTAIRALEVGGPLLGRRVLVTGAAGGVGRLRDPARPPRRRPRHRRRRGPERGEGLRELGADELITELSPRARPFDLMIDSVGGASLGAAFARVGRGARWSRSAPPHRADHVRLGDFYTRVGPSSTGCGCLTSWRSAAPGAATSACSSASSPRPAGPADRADRELARAGRRAGRADGSPRGRRGGSCRSTSGA